MAVSMTPQQLSARRMVQAAWQAMQAGNKTEARRRAEQAVNLAPDLEDAWIMLAALAGPKAALGYLQRALQINPNSQRAQAGLRWAERQLAAAPQKRTVLPAKTPRSISWPYFVMGGLVVTMISAVMLASLWLITSSGVALARPEAASPVSAANPASVPEEASSEQVLVLPVLQSTPQPTPLPNLVAYQEQPAITESIVVTEAPTQTPSTNQPHPEDPQPEASPTQADSGLVMTFVDSAPAASPEQAPESASLPADGRYIVQSGDTPSALARRFGVSLPALLSINGLNTSSVIYPGQELIIPDANYVPTQPVVEQPASGGGKYILVDISEQHLYAYENGALVYSFVASTGMNNATRVGTFAVQSKIPSAYGATWNIWMPNWMGIYWAGSLENGIHSLPILPNGQRLWAGYLGTPISYGCVVLGEYESSLLYNWAEIGTPVEIRW